MTMAMTMMNHYVDVDKHDDYNAASTEDDDDDDEEPSAGVINVTLRLFRSHLSCFYHHFNSWIVQHYALIWVNLQQFVASKFSNKYS